MQGLEEAGSYVLENRVVLGNSGGSLAAREGSREPPLHPWITSGKNQLFCLSFPHHLQVS